MKTRRILSGALAGLMGAQLAVAGDLAPSNAPPALLPPRPELPPSFWEQYGLWVSLGVMLLLAVAVLLFFLLRRPRPPAAVFPAAEARLRLEPLRRQPETGVVLSLVSQVLRRYFAAAFGLPQQEMNTTEFCRAVAGHPQLGEDLSSALAAFLRACDQHKFPPQTVAPPPLDAVSRALKLIEQAEARRVVPPAAVAPPSTG